MHETKIYVIKQSPECIAQDGGALGDSGGSGLNQHEEVVLAAPLKNEQEYWG